MVERGESALLVEDASTVSFGDPGGQVPAGVEIVWDFDGDGDFSEAIEDVTNYVTEWETSTGKDFATNIDGKVTGGILTMAVDNSDDRFSMFNDNSPLNQGGLSVDARRKIRVQPVGSTYTDPAVLAVDRFDGSGTMGSTEDGLPWTLWTGTAHQRVGGFAEADASGGHSVDVGASDFYAQIRTDINDPGNKIGIAYRITDDDNYGAVFFEVDSPNFVRIKHRTVVAGAVTDVELTTDENRRQMTLGVRLSGTQYAVSIDGVFLTTGTAAGTTQTTVGTFVDRGLQRAPKFDEFQVWDKAITSDIGDAVWTGFIQSVKPRRTRTGEKIAVVTAYSPLARLAAVDVEAPR